MFNTSAKLLLSTFSLCFLFACVGEPGNNGAAGSSCTISDNGDGTKTIRCEDGTSAVIQDGRNGFSGATGATGAPGDPGDPGNDGEDGDDGVDGTDCTVTDNGDGTATITCEDGTTVTIGTPTTTDTDAGSAEEEATDAGMSEAAADSGVTAGGSDGGMGADATDAGMSEAITDGGMSEAITDGGMSDEASDSGTLDETTDAGHTSASGGFSFHYGFEADDYAAPTNDPVTYNAGGDVWAAVSAVGPINEASEGTVFWGMQDLDNNENSGYHTLTFGPYDVSSFGGGTFSFDYFTIGYDASDKIGFALLLDDTNLPNLDVTDAALTMLNGDTVGEWTNQLGSFGASVTSVTLVIAATQNGGSDYAGVDNFLLTCDNCEAPTVTSCGAGATLTLPTTIADGVCTDCESGTYDDDADDSTACIAHTVTSGDCAAGQLFSEGTTTADGSCADIICEADQSVASNACEACAAGTSNEAGDSATGTDTDCDAVVCPANSEGTDVVSGCTCSNGFSGTIIAATEAPYYTGSCDEAVGCADGTWDHDSDSATDCVAHTVCDTNATQTSAGDATTDAVCECNTGYFGDGATCAAHTVTDCADGQTLTAGTTTADGSCTDCAAGNYDDDADALTPCIAHTVTDCAAGQTLTAGTTTADGSCTDCASGEWDDDGDATTVCVAHTACDTNATEITPGTSTADAACECNTGFFGDGDSCDPTKNLGEACTDNAECTSGTCDNSVCATAPPMHLGASGCTYTSYVLSDGTLLCGTNDKTAKYYTNGTGTALSADLDLDGTPDVEYRSGGTWTTWASDLGSSTPTFAENPANGDIYYTQLLFDGGVTTTIWKSEGGVLGTKSEFATGLDVEVFDSGITSDTTYLYARTGVDEVTRYEMATGTSTVITTSGIPSADSMAVGDQYLYISTEYQIFRVDKVNGGAGEVFAGTGVAGANYAEDGVDATTVAITIPSKSVASVVQERVYFVDQSGYTGGKVRYVTPDGKLETVEEIESSINQGVFVRGDLAYAKTYQIAAPIAP